MYSSVSIPHHVPADVPGVEPHDEREHGDGQRHVPRRHVRETDQRQRGAVLTWGGGLIGTSK